MASSSPTRGIAGIGSGAVCGRGASTACGGISGSVCAFCIQAVGSIHSSDPDAMIARTAARSPRTLPGHCCSTLHHRLRDAPMRGGEVLGEASRQHRDTVGALERRHLMIHSARRISRSWRKRPLVTRCWVLRVAAMTRRSTFTDCRFRPAGPEPPAASVHRHLYRGLGVADLVQEQGPRFALTTRPSWRFPAPEYAPAVAKQLTLHHAFAQAHSSQNEEPGGCDDGSPAPGPLCRRRSRPG